MGRSLPVDDWHWSRYFRFGYPKGWMEDWSVFEDHQTLTQVGTGNGYNCSVTVDRVNQDPDGPPPPPGFEAVSAGTDVWSEADALATTRSTMAFPNLAGARRLIDKPEQVVLDRERGLLLRLDGNVDGAYWDRPGKRVFIIWIEVLALHANALYIVQLRCPKDILKRHEGALQTIIDSWDWRDGAKLSNPDYFQPSDLTPDEQDAFVEDILPIFATAPNIAWITSAFALPMRVPGGFSAAVYPYSDVHAMGTGGREVPCNPGDVARRAWGRLGTVIGPRIEQALGRRLGNVQVHVSVDRSGSSRALLEYREA